MEAIGSALIICEWTSRYPGQGYTETELAWLRSRGFNTIVAQGVGLIEDGAPDTTTCYWQHLKSKGLVDVLIDDRGQELAPVGQALAPCNDNPVVSP